MHVMKAPRTPALVQVVDVLRAEVETIAHLFFDGGQCPVRGVGLRVRRVPATHGVEAPHELRVCLPRLRRSDLLYAMAVPESTRSAKRCEAALSGDACSGEHEEPVLWTETHK